MTAPLARALPVVLLAGLLCLLPRLQAEDAIRIAILSDADQKDAADLLTTKLSANQGIILVERTEIDHILQEQQLSLTGLTSDDALKVGQLLHAQGIVLLKSIPTQEGAYLDAALVSVTSGAILGSLSTPDKAGEVEQLVDAISARILTSLPKFQVTAQQATKLSVVNFRSLRGDSSIESPFTRLFAAFLSDYPELFVLERNSLQTIAKEKNLSSSATPFWTGSYLIRGTIEAAVDAPNTLTVHVELVPPGRDRGTVFTVTGDKTKLQELAHSAAAAIAQSFKQTKAHTASWDSTREAEMFLQEADLAFRNGKINAAYTDAFAAQALGLQSPRLNEILILIYLQKLKVIPNRANLPKYAHYDDCAVLPAYLQPLVKLASEFEYNPKYWRGWPAFQFPEGLDQVDTMIDSYRAFLAATGSDPAQRKIDDTGMLDANVLFAASLPHLLICREPEPERYKARLARMAADLRNLCHDILQSNLSADQRHQILKLQAAMLPFWSDEKNDLAAAIRQIQKDYSRPDQFVDRAYIQCGLMTGCYLAMNYSQRKVYELFRQIGDDSLKSNAPEERVLGDYLHYYTLGASAMGRQGRIDNLTKLYTDLEALMPEAATDPKALGIYLLEIERLFYSENWSNYYTPVPVPAQAYDIDLDQEEIVPYLTHQLAYKYLLFLIDHWPDKLPCDFTHRDNGSPFSFWADAPGTMAAHSGHPPDTSTKAFQQLLSDYYLPLLKRYHEEKANPSPNPEKLKYLTRVYLAVQKSFPQLLANDDTQADATPTSLPTPFGERDPNNPGVLAHPKWSLPAQLAKLGVPDSTPSRVGSLQGFPGGLRLLCFSGSDVCNLLEVSLPGLETKSIPILVAKLPNNNLATTPHDFIQTGHFLYLFNSPVMVNAAPDPLLRYDLAAGEWKNLAPLTALQGFEHDGFLYFSNHKEFYRLRPEIGQPEILASVERTPSGSPFDHPEISQLSAGPTSDGKILVVGQMEENNVRKSLQYYYDPATARWEEKPPAIPTSFTMPSRMEVPLAEVACLVPPELMPPGQAPPQIIFQLLRDMLMISLIPPDSAPFPRPLFHIPVTFEGRDHTNQTTSQQMLGNIGGIVFSGDTGLLLTTGFFPVPSANPSASDPFTIWSVDYPDIDAYVKQHPYVAPQKP